MRTVEGMKPGRCDTVEGMQLSSKGTVEGMKPSRKAAIEGLKPGRSGKLRSHALDRLSADANTVTAASPSALFKEPPPSFSRRGPPPPAPRPPHGAQPSPLFMADGPSSVSEDREEEAEEPYRLRAVGHSLGGANLLIHCLARRAEGAPCHVHRLVLLTPAGFHVQMPPVRGGARSRSLLVCGGYFYCHN